MKKLLTPLFLIALITACSTENKNLSISNTSDSALNFRFLTLNDSLIWESQIKSNSALDTDLNSDVYIIEIENIGKAQVYHNQLTQITIDSTIMINGTGQSDYLAYEKFRKSSLQKWISPIRKQAAKEKQADKIDSLRLVETKNYEIHLEELWDYSLKHLDTSIALVHASYRWRAFDMDRMNELDEGYKNRFPASSASKVLTENIRVLERFNLGQTFELKPFNNIDGSLESPEFLGKKTLIEFWASWCPPCRRDAKYISEIAKQKNWNVISINLDTREKSWLDAIEKDQRTWTQLNSPMGLNSKNIKFYGIRALPYNFILGKEGEIEQVNIHGKELIELIKE